MKLSIAIPTFNSSKYIYSCLKSISRIKSVDEIIINDDFSDRAEFIELKRIVNSFLKSKKLNINIYQNKKNMGGFKNKYNAISKVSNEFVYQIDSDNLACINANKLFSTNFIKNLDNESFYLPSSVYVFKDGKNPYLSSIQKKYRVRLSNKNLTLDRNQIVKSYKEKTDLFIDVRNNWVFNLGNFIVNKNSFLKNMLPGTMDNSLPLEADPMAMSYFWLKNSGKIKLINNFYHFHRLRANSYWVTKGEKAKNSIIYFENFIKNLNDD